MPRPPAPDFAGRRAAQARYGDLVRYLALALLAAGCLQQPDDPTPIPPSPPSPAPTPTPPPSPPPPPPSPGAYCTVDTDCPADQVCARDAACTAPSEVHWVHVRWTVDGATADATTCAAAPDLLVDIGNFTDGEGFGVAPVPCVAGLYSVDKIPLSWSTVSVAPYVGEGGWQDGVSATVDPATGNATVDLSF
jgi:hypothetical protein